MDADKLKDLGQFTGTEHWYRHPIVRRVTYTDGVQHVAEHGGAYWLLDKVAISQLSRRIAGEEFQVWKLKRDAEGDAADLTVEDGNGNELHSERIDFTDFPLPEIVFWFANNVILLPSEY